MDDEKYILETDTEDDALAHIGRSARDGAEIGSGRYRLGSGENPFQHLEGIYGQYRKLHMKGVSDGEIAKSLGMSTGELRARNAYYKALKDNMNITKAIEYKNKGYSNVEIAQKLGVSPSTVGNLVKAYDSAKEAKIISTRNALKGKVDEVGWTDIGHGTEALMGIKRTMLDDAVITLQDEGYEVYSNLRVRQGGTGNYTTLRVLAKPGMTRGDVLKDKGNTDAVMTDIRSTDGGETFKKKGPPVNVDLKRVDIRYADDPISGKDLDGVIELRRGVPDLDLGNAHYAQVRIAIGDKYYAKGMAVYADDLPDGVDIRVNSNKQRSQGVSKALKEQKTLADGSGIDRKDPFGTTTKEDKDLRLVTNYYTDADGKEHQSALNFVNEEGGWERWDRNLPSQFLGKQPPKLAKQQLKIDIDAREKEYQDICSLTNPVLKESLLLDYAQACDSAAEHLKAAAFPRQATHTILPSRTLKENEIYAPRYEDGEEVILVRFPHGGQFEIPRLKVNNKNKEAKERISNSAKDAVCINPATAAILSGADFDGDTVLVIPTKNNPVQNKSPLKDLKNFETDIYKMSDEQIKNNTPPVWGKGTQREQTEMGKISNLITDMTLQGASEEELARAVKHSMVVIDVAKHKLDYRRSEKENRISELKKIYQHNDDKPDGGAHTLLSRAKKKTDLVGVKSYGDIDPETGEYILRPDTEKVPKRKKVGTDPATGKDIWETVDWVPKTRKSTMMRDTKDAYTLTSGGSKEHPGTEIEGVYADYANTMKAMANRARKEYLKARSTPQPKTKGASGTYQQEVDHLKYQLLQAKKNAPLERKALAIAQSQVELYKQDAYNSLSKGEESKMLDKEVKKARLLVGASRYRVHISDSEWDAIQAGAVSKSDQRELFKFADGDEVRQRAMPKTQTKLSKSILATAQSMLDRGYTWTEVAEKFDVSVSTLSKALNDE